MKSKTDLLEMLVIELALLALKSAETTPGERMRLNHILGDLQYPRTVETQIDMLKTALQTAINTVECASLDKSGVELPWYRQAKTALAYELPATG